jgi:hypothetical protein
MRPYIGMTIVAVGNGFAQDGNAGIVTRVVNENVAAVLLFLDEKPLASTMSFCQSKYEARKRVSCCYPAREDERWG